MFFGLGLALGTISAIFILAVSHPIIASYKVSEETVKIAEQLMLAISLIIIFQATNSIMTKGVLRGGGDTKILMIADNLFLWVLAIPLGYLAGFVFHWPAFWIYVCLKSTSPFFWNRPQTSSSWSWRTAASSSLRNTSDSRDGRLWTRTIPQCALPQAGPPQMRI